MRHLEELGYIDPPDPDDLTEARRAAEELRANLALAYMDGGKPAEAAPILRELVAVRPEERRFLLALAECALALGNLAECRQLLGTIYGEDRAWPQADLLLGIVLLAEGRTEEALVRFLRAEGAAPGLPKLHNQLGALYLKTRRWADAERAFRRALEIDADSAPAHTGLAVTARRQGDVCAAADWALRAVGLQHFHPAAHLQLGLALARLGELARAARALEVCLSMRPGSPAARRMLNRVNRGSGSANDGRATRVRIRVEPGSIHDTRAL